MVFLWLAGGLLAGLLVAAAVAGLLRDAFDWWDEDRG